MVTYLIFFLMHQIPLFAEEEVERVFHCSIKENYENCAKLPHCYRSTYKAHSKTREGCKVKAYAYCREFCEVPPKRGQASKKDPRGKCKCGDTVYED